MAKKTSNRKVKIRLARREDVPALAALNRIAYPTLAEDDVVWGESHLFSHQRIFPEGQLVAEIGGKVVGAAASLIVDLGKDPLRHHTWSGITDSGYFSNHDPEADTLYGADVCVHPDYRGARIGHELYEARRELCRRMNLRRILAGGRLWNYSEHADKYTAHEYAQRVADGEIRDLVLSFQLREGFQLRGVMANYLHDRRSHNHASLIEWLNPDYQADAKGARKVRVACVQYQVRKIKSFDDFVQQVTYFTDVASDYKSDFVLFPEFFSVQLLSYLDALSPQEGIRKLASLTPRFVKLFRKLAMSYGMTLIGGSHPVEVAGTTGHDPSDGILSAESGTTASGKGGVRSGGNGSVGPKRLENVAMVFLPDGSIARQPKIHITPNERHWWGISGGHELGVIHTPKAKIGILICYDTEFPEAARFLADEGAEILFVPFCTDNRQGYIRVRSCAQARAIENQLYVAMAGTIGNLPDVDNMDLNYAQAAVFTPSDFAFPRDGIAAEAGPNDETVLICDLDLNSLIENRYRGTVTPRLDRRPDLFRMQSSIATARELERRANEGPLGDQPMAERTRQAQDTENPSP